MNQKEVDGHIALLEEQGMTHDQAVTTVWMAIREERIASVPEEC